jgi:hypothetical protein
VQLDLELDMDGRPGDRPPASSAPATAAVTDGSTTAPPADQTPVVDTPNVTQTNSVSASASAAATVDLSQTGADDGSVVQTIASSQIAQANAEAVQTGASNLSVVTSGVLAGLDQSNTVSSDATAKVDLTASQTAALDRDDEDAPAGTSAGTQAIASSQTATASTQAVQTKASNVSRVSSLTPSTATIGKIEQQNDVSAVAVADSTSMVDQTLTQSQAGAGPQDAVSTQSSSTSQAATAAAEAAQTHVGNLSDILIPKFGVSNPALSQGNSLAASATASNGSSTSQTVNQASSNVQQEVLFSFEAEQQADVKQSGTAGSVQAQTNRLNSAGWNGLVVEPQQPAEEPQGSSQGQFLELFEAQAPQTAQAAASLVPLPGILAHAVRAARNPSSSSSSHTHATRKLAHRAKAHHPA